MKIKQFIYGFNDDLYEVISEFTGKNGATQLIAEGPKGEVIMVDPEDVEVYPVTERVFALIYKRVEIEKSNIWANLFNVGIAQNVSPATRG